MKRKTKIVMIFAGAVLLLSGLTGCGVDRAADGSVIANNNANVDSISSFYVKAVDGRNVPCIWVAGYQKGGLSCDWSAK